MYSIPMKGITCCGDCVYYNTKKHKCNRCNSIETDARSHFYDDCPLPDVVKSQEPITGETSDGYHTFNELYHHRAVLFSVIVANYPDKAWKSKKHHDGTMYDGMFIVGIDTPDGQATYHYDIDPYWDMFKCRVLDNAPEWDGHTPAQAIERIGKLKAQEPHWIPFHMRPLTAEEKEIHPEWIYILDCALPDDDEEILVSNGKYVWTDTYINNGDECYLDSGQELDGAAWMPMPEAYKEAKEHD